MNSQPFVFESLHEYRVDDLYNDSRDLRVGAPSRSVGLLRRLATRLTALLSDGPTIKTAAQSHSTRIRPAAGR